MVGLIVHVPTSPRWIPFWKGQHWFGILRLANGAYIDLDSRLSLPTAFAGFADVMWTSCLLMAIDVTGWFTILTSLGNALLI